MPNHYPTSFFFEISLYNLFAMAIYFQIPVNNGPVFPKNVLVALGLENISSPW